MHRAGESTCESTPQAQMPTLSHKLIQTSFRDKTSRQCTQVPQTITHLLCTQAPIDITSPHHTHTGPCMHRWLTQRHSLRVCSHSQSPRLTCFHTDILLMTRGTYSALVT